MYLGAEVKLLEDWAAFGRPCTQMEVDFVDINFAIQRSTYTGIWVSELFAQTPCKLIETPNAPLAYRISAFNSSHCLLNGKLLLGADAAVL